MKTISQKQFETAVAKVLKGGKSNLISTSEVKPLYWTRSGGYNNLRGSIPANSKFLRNDARGGKENDVYLVCNLAAGYEIAKTKAELKKETALKAKQNKLLSSLRQAKANEMKNLATKLGFSSVAKLKEAQKEIDTFNNARFDRAIAKRLETYESEFGKFQEYKLADRVRISRIELVFDCEKKENLFV